MRKDELERAIFVSMKSGLEDRNNDTVDQHDYLGFDVSMKSGLEDRNNGQDTW